MIEFILWSGDSWFVENRDGHNMNNGLNSLVRVLLILNICHHISHGLDPHIIPYFVSFIILNHLLELFADFYHVGFCILAD